MAMEDSLLAASSSAASWLDINKEDAAESEQVSTVRCLFVIFYRLCIFVIPYATAAVTILGAAMDP